MKRYIVHSGGTERIVEVAESGGVYEVTLEGTVYRVDSRGGGSSPTRSLLIDGASYEAATFPGRDGLDVFVSGDAFHVKVTDELWARAEAEAHGASSGETILSPMPGSVVKVLVRRGEIVTPGRSVVVVEAMKMQNELAALRGGRVAEIKVAPGDVVEQDAVLVVLEAEEA